MVREKNIQKKLKIFERLKAFFLPSGYSKTAVEERIFKKHRDENMNLIWKIYKGM